MITFLQQKRDQLRTAKDSEESPVRLVLPTEEISTQNFARWNLHIINCQNNEKIIQSSVMKKGKKRFFFSISTTIPNSKARLRWTGRSATEVENESFTVVYFTLMFGRLGHRILLKCVPHVQHAYFSSFNQSDHRLMVLKFPVSTS